MPVVERTCLNCNGSGKTRVLNQHGHDTGRDRPCGTCDGTGKIVPASALRGAVEVFEAACAWADSGQPVTDGADGKLRDAVKKARRLGGQ